MFIVTITGTCTRDESAHEDYLTLERFAELRETDKTIGYNVGDTVAALMSESGALKIVYGRILGSEHPKTGSVYSLITRDGDRMETEHKYLCHI